MCDLTPVSRTDLLLDTRAARAARDFVRRTSCQHHHFSRMDEAELLVSELVANGVRHGAPPIELTVSCDGDSLRVAVSDGSPEQPVVQYPEEDAEGGRGMRLVDALSEAWGVQPVSGGSGKTTWFCL